MTCEVEAVHFICRYFKSQLKDNLGGRIGDRKKLNMLCIVFLQHGDLRAQDKICETMKSYFLVKIFDDHNDHDIPWWSGNISECFLVSSVATFEASTLCCGRAILNLKCVKWIRWDFEMFMVTISAVALTHASPWLPVPLSAIWCSKSCWARLLPRTNSQSNET